MLHFKKETEMEIKDNRMDAGKAFDWGKTSEYYAKYRDIYPDEFYQRVADRGLLRFAPSSGHRCVCQWPPSVASGRG